MYYVVVAVKRSDTVKPISVGGVREALGHATHCKVHWAQAGDMQAVVMQRAQRHSLNSRFATQSGNRHQCEVR
jgi:hypothetical protein